MLSLGVLGGQTVVPDADRAALFGVAPKGLNEQVRRNPERFEGCAVPPTAESARVADCDFKTRPWRAAIAALGVTEHGAAVAATVFDSDQAGAP